MTARNLRTKGKCRAEPPDTAAKEDIPDAIEENSNVYLQEGAGPDQPRELTTLAEELKAANALLPNEAESSEPALIASPPKPVDTVSVNARPAPLEITADASPRPRKASVQAKSEGREERLELVRPDANSELADVTHELYDALEGELQVCMEWQQNLLKQHVELTKRIRTVQDKARARRLMFSQGLEMAREIAAIDRENGMPSPSNAVSGESVLRQADEPEDEALNSAPDVASHVRPDECAYLFRARSPSEDSDEYHRRQSEQKYYIARERYEAGVRERNARAEEQWREIYSRHVNSDAREQEYENHLRQGRRRYTTPQDDPRAEFKPEESGAWRLPSGTNTRAPTPQGANGYHQGRQSVGAGGGGGGAPPPHMDPMRPTDLSRKSSSRGPANRAREQSSAHYERGPSYLSIERAGYLTHGLEADPNAEYTSKLQYRNAYCWICLNCRP
ncbi:hypothetical protein C8Q73DRAFT_442267 [Cubamyces lactineus]|nr:hypothetical protein C8Q73DRAFT_442267 [Cubamyces lactineus]